MKTKLFYLMFTGWLLCGNALFAQDNNNAARTAFVEASIDKLKADITLTAEQEQEIRKSLDKLYQAREEAEKKNNSNSEKIDEKRQYQLEYQAELDNILTDEQKKILQQKARKSKLPKKQMRYVDVKKLIEETAQSQEKDTPFRFGYGFDVNYNLNDGIWEENDSVKIWCLEISSPVAYSLNFFFQKLFLAHGAQLFICNSDGTMVYEPITEEQNAAGNHFLTDLIAGDNVTIQLIEPKNVKQPSSLTINRIVHGYINLFKVYPNVGNAEFDMCHNDVICYPDWDKESDAVALVLLSNREVICSGSLLNNTMHDYTPYFLSAFHCIDLNSNGTINSSELNAAQNWAFRFQYKKTACNGNTVSSFVTYNQATFRAGWQSSDFLLMELVNSAVSANTNLSFLGWDKSGNTPSQGTIIHHPFGNVMKISFDYNSLVTYDYANNHWYVQIEPSNSSLSFIHSNPNQDTENKTIEENTVNNLTIKALDDIRIYPNPATDYLVIELSNDAKTIELLSLSGVKLYEQRSKQSFRKNQYSTSSCWHLHHKSLLKQYKV